MATWDAVDHYYSGQGVVMLGLRDAEGQPKGLTAVGNVPDLKITVNTSSLEHKESHTGARGTDLRLTTEVKVGLSMTMENFIAENLARVLRSAALSIVEGAVTNIGYKAYPGAVTPLKHIRISKLGVKGPGNVTLTPFSDGVAAYDYRVNERAGSIKFNDGASLPLDKLGAPVTGLTVGSTTTLTIADTGCTAGDTIVINGATGADASLINGVILTVLSATKTAVVVDLDTTGKVITTVAATKAVYGGMAITVSYNYAASIKVGALTEGAKELYMRFEGLNTADGKGGLTPVIVNVFKISADPLKELELIADGVQKFTLEGSVLADSLRTEGSPYFEVITLPS